MWNAERRKALYRPILGLASILAILYLNFGDKFRFPVILWQPRMSFISTVNSSHLFIDQETGHPLAINGWNSYWLMDQSIWAGPSRQRVSEMLSRGAGMGMTVCRTWAFSDGGPNALQISPGVFDERVFQALDFVIAEARKHRIRLILSLVNNLNAFGGKAQYVRWAQAAGVNVTSTPDSFFSDSTIKGYYKDYVKDSRSLSIQSTRNGEESCPDFCINKSNGSSEDEDFEEGEVDVGHVEEETIKGVEVEILPTAAEDSPGADIPARSPTAIEEEERLDYGEYSPGICAANISAIPPAEPSVATSPRASIVPLVVQKVVVREIIFPTETTDLPTPTTRDSSTEARAPSLADMAGIAPSVIHEAPPPANRIPITVIPSCSGAASSDSVTTMSSFANVPLHKMLIVKHSLSAIIHIFKNPDQWSDLDAATEILESSARMAKIDISSLRSSLLKFRDSIISLASVENITIPPEILEYGKQLTVSQEQASLAASSLSKLEREHIILQEQLQAHSKEREAVQNHIATLKDRIAALNEEISQLEIQDCEQGLAIQGVEEMIQTNAQSIDSEKSALLHSKEIIASLESKLAGVPDQAKLILEEKSKHDAAQAQLREDLRKYTEAMGISAEL